MESKRKTTANAIRIDTLDVKLGGRTVLDRVSVRFEPGKITGLIGPNGAGKSTLLRVVCGIERRYEGQVLLGDERLSELSAIERAKRITYVGSEVETEFPLSALETVALGTYPLGLRRLEERDFARIRGVMEETGCWVFADRALPVLSSGERQRVHLARALLQGSAWICLDESFSRLDLHHQARIGALLRKYVERGSSFLFVSHDLNFTTDWADRCVLLKDGVIMGEGETKLAMTEANLRKLYPDAEIVLSPHPITGAMKVYFRG
jgi:iron complex transport system ATP-binding protein